MPLAIYRILLRHFGPQGWWPTTAAGELSPRYHPRKHAALSGTERFEICAGAFLTQNTAWSNVEKALASLSRSRSLDVSVIAGMDTALLEELIRPSGYYRQKAARLQGFCRHIEANCGGSVAALFDGPPARCRESLLALKGIGPETADSMLLYAGGLHFFVVDAYTRRIGRRLGLFRTEDYRRIQSYFRKNLPVDVSLYNEYHALLVALAKNFCRTNPRCAGCPLTRYCSHGKRINHSHAQARSARAAAPHR